MTLIKEIVSKGNERDQYKPSESTSELIKRYGVEPSKLIKLNANENLFLSRGFQQRIVKLATSKVDPRLYPLEDGRLEREIAFYLKVAPKAIVLGNGSDQLIELLVYTLLREDDEIVAINPTFGMYRRAAGIKRATYKPVDLNPNFTLDEDRLLDAVSPETRMIVVCNPNNPTGNQFEKTKLVKILESFDGLVVVDEAYVEYADYSMVRVTRKYPNLVTLRTFSKAFGLAGVRLGYAVMSEELAASIKKVYQMPYTVSELSQEIGLQALKKRKTVVDNVKKTLRMRKWLYNKLSFLKGVKVYNSYTNFLLFSTSKTADEVYSGLLRRGVLIRRFGKILEDENCLRVTVAPLREMNRFLEALMEVLEC